MTEAELQAETIALALSLGLLVAWTQDSRRSPRGEPDLRIAGLRGVLWAEVKDADGRLSPEQTAWRWRLLASGQAWRLYRPADWHSGRIELDLRSIA